MRIRSFRAPLFVALGLILFGAAGINLAQAMHLSNMAVPALPASAAQARSGSRLLVQFPPEVKRETLATMRMHLQGLGEIQQAMAQGHYDQAAQIAAMKLGMSSMHSDQARQEARYMPPAMRELGAQLHMQASAFAVAAQDAAATGDGHKPQVVFGQMIQTCVACHAAYKLQ